MRWSPARPRPTRSGRRRRNSTSPANMAPGSGSTGPVPIANEEYATVQDGAIVNGIGTVLVVLLILWMALHSAKIIFAVFINLFIGLAITTAVGLMMVGSLNLLSIAFAVLFVGLGVDFGIQFSVRYRSERFKNDDIAAGAGKCRKALRGSAVAGRDGDRGRLPLLPADRLQGHLGTRQDRRRRHADCVPDQHHGAAGAAENAATRPAKASRSATPSWRRSTTSSKSTASSSSSARILVAVAGLPLLYFMKFDFNPINLRNSQGRIDRDLPRSAQGSEHRRQRHQRDDEFGSRGEEDRGAAGKGAGSAARDFAGQFCAARTSRPS